MTTLTFDVANDHCAVALFCGADLLATRSENAPRGQADRLFPMIDAAFADAGCDWPDVDLVATVAGPGSFAGVRVGVAAARSLSLALERPAVGIDGFEAYAAALQGREGDVAAVVFGKPPRLLWRRFRGGAPLDEQPVAGDADALTAALGPRDAATIIGPAASRLPASFNAQISAVDPGVLLQAAATIAVDAWTQARDDGRPIAPPTPFYLRPPDAAPSSTVPPARLPTGGAGNAPS